MVGAYLCVQHRRIQQESDSGFEKHEDSARKLAGVYEGIKKNCDLALSQVEVLNDAPGMWPALAARHAEIIREIKGPADEGMADNIKAPEKFRRNALHGSYDALLLRFVLYGCGHKDAREVGVKKPIGFFTGWLELAVLGRAEMPVQPVFTWMQTAEEAGGLHPRTVHTLTQAAKSFDHRELPSKQVLDHVKRMLGI